MYATDWTTRKLGLTGTITRTCLKKSINHTYFVYSSRKIVKYSSTQIFVCTRWNNCWLNFKHTSHWKMQGSHRDVDKHSSFLGCYAILTGKQLLILWKSTVISSSGSNSPSFCQMLEASELCTSVLLRTE